LARFDFTHEILANEESKFRGKPVPRQRRISVICREFPQRNDVTTLEPEIK
jgi:alkylated DNA repair protein alkB homolog 7